MTTIVQEKKKTRAVSWMGTDYTITVSKGDSAGLIGVFEGRVPAGDGPPVHIHHNEDEVIHVIEGDYEFWLDGKTERAGPGRSVFLPRGVPHTFRVVGDRPGRNLAILTPGGFEEFFIKAAEQDLTIPEDMAAVVELAGLYGLEFVGPADWA
ncbi:cupin domain-containing protein [Oricola cellulosilytica]|nr:cupin domain-containing protein [Oricola cellulosilytica]